MISWAKPNYWGKEKAYVLEALESGWISQGQYLARLEQDFSKLLHKKYVLSMANGTVSLQAAYLALGIGPGDEVIVPGFGFMAAANMALHQNAQPIFAEVDRDSWCVTAATIKKKITRRTKAIVPIHTYGNVCDLDDIIDLGKKKGIPIIEDCAESLFSKYRGKFSGSLGTISSFSFQATKTITTGEGGLVATDDRRIYETMGLYRNHGLRVRGTYKHELPGSNFRLTNIQAALGLAQFKKRKQIIASRKKIHNLYTRYLSGDSAVKLQTFSKNVDPVLWAMAVCLDARAFRQGRDRVIQQLLKKGIETRPGFTASSRLSIYKKHSLPVCEEISRQVLSLPTYATLREAQVAAICKALRGLKK